MSLAKASIRNNLFPACAIAAAFLTTSARADLAGNAAIPASEKDVLSEVYRLEVPDSSGGWNSAAIPYIINNAASTATGYTRVAYYVEMGVSGNPGATQYAYASFDVIPDLDQANELGIPSNGPNGSGKVIKAGVSNMRVYTNGTGATSGTFATGGNLEFWPSNYGPGTNGVFDYDDDGYDTGSGHGSMQIHNGGLGQTLFGYNAWGTVRESEMGVGIGPNPSGNSGGAQPDWTFNEGNNDNFNVQTLQIFVQPVPEPASLGLLAGAAGMLLKRRRRA